MIERLPRGKRNLALALLFALLGWFCWSIRSVLNPVLLGYLCAYILHPVVLRIERHGFSRRTAVNLTFAGGFVLAMVVVLFMALQVRGLAAEVVQSARAGSAAIGDAPAPDEIALQAPPTFVERLQTQLDAFHASLQELGLEGLPELEISAHGLQEAGAFVLAHLGEDAAAIGLDAAEQGGLMVSRFVGRLSALAGMFVLVPLYAYYFLFVQKRMNEFVRRYLPRHDRERLARTAGDIGQVIASFFRGRLGVCFVKGLALSAGLWIADVDYAFLFGMASGFLSVIPFFGPFLGFALAFLVGILDHGVVSALVRTGIVFGIGEVLEGYVLVPKILGDSLGLHPLVVFIALLAGGAALGMLGVLIALPLTASLVIVVKEFVLPALADFADEERAVSS